MFAELISVVEARPGIKIIELEFVEGNDRTERFMKNSDLRLLEGVPTLIN